MSRAAPAAAFGGLHVLADDDPRWPHDPVQQARAACTGGASVVQLRSKHATDAQTLRWAREIRELTRSAGVTFIVNDRFDLALAARADGVHLGQDDLPPDRIPLAARRQLSVGRSTHDRAQAERARREPVDYVAYGPVFGTTSKNSPYEARGLAATRWIAALVQPLPLVAIGGVDASTIATLREAGVAGFAVISAVAAAPDPAEATRTLRRAVERAT